MDLFEKIECLQPKNACSALYHNQYPTIFNELMKECRGLCMDVDYGEILQNQWSLLPNYFNYDKAQSKQINEVWIDISNFQNAENCQIFVELGHFVLHILALPHSNVLPERRFSDMNHRKTKNTNKLSNKTINGLIHTSQANNTETGKFEPTLDMINKMMSSTFYK
ncbi:hypothetical protein TKK_0016014 [Trichogramma kaykai]